MFLTNWVLFAEQAPPAKAPSANPWISWMPLILIGFLFYFLLMRPQRKERDRRQSMLTAIKKNDRVVTAGGIYGVVSSVHAEGDEVILKVDESTNTKLRVTLSSVARVLSDESSHDNSK